MGKGHEPPSRLITGYDRRHLCLLECTPLAWQGVSFRPQFRGPEASIFGRILVTGVRSSWSNKNIYLLPRNLELGISAGLPARKATFCRRIPAFFWCNRRNREAWKTARGINRKQDHVQPHAASALLCVSCSWRLHRTMEHSHSGLAAASASTSGPSIT